MAEPGASLPHDVRRWTTPSNPRDPGGNPERLNRGRTCPRFAWPGAVPPISLFAGPVFTKMPPARLSSVGRPAASRPRALPWMTLPTAWAPKSWIPTDQVARDQVAGPRRGPADHVVRRIVDEDAVQPVGDRRRAGRIGADHDCPAPGCPTPCAPAISRPTTPIAGDHVLLHRVARRLADQDPDDRTGQAGRAVDVGPDQVAQDQVARRGRAEDVNPHPLVGRACRCPR